MGLTLTTLAIVPAVLLALYVPTFAALWQGLWQVPMHSHGPVLLAVALWLFVARWSEQWRDPGLALQPLPRVGWPLLGVGVVFYIIGRSQDFAALEVASLVPVLAGCTLILFGAAFVRRMWFAYLFMLFLIPLPGSLVDSITQPMKIAVSQAAEALLYAAGYPIARAGVMLSIGPYQLLVADACAGLTSLFVLEAVGLLYLNLMRHASALRNIVLALLVLPVSFIANVVRVSCLVLVTYHFGDAAGQGFLHEFSGIVLLVCALLLLVAADSALRWGLSLRSPMATVRVVR
jgi:exosortase B